MEIRAVEVALASDTIILGTTLSGAHPRGHAAMLEPEVAADDAIQRSEARDGVIFIPGGTFRMGSDKRQRKSGRSRG
jgi:hypothetical protein